MTLHSHVEGVQETEFSVDIFSALDVVRSVVNVVTSVLDDTVLGSTSINLFSRELSHGHECAGVNLCKSHHFY